jgi:DNA polymerase I
VPDEWNYNKETKERTSPKITLSSLESLGASDLGKWIARYYVLKHRRNFLENKKDPEDKGIISKIREDGRIGADALTLASKTGRMRHIDIVNVPKCAPKVIYGCDLRGCFCVKPPYKMVGADLSAIEARLIGHYTSYFDDGVMAKELLFGDLHSRNMSLINRDRATSKQFFYALCFGSQAKKQSQILNCSLMEAERIIKTFFDGNPGLKKLIDYLEKYYKKHGCIKSLDGREMKARSPHVLLNLLIQSSAAQVFKKWLCNIWESIDEEQLDAEVIISMHDEVQLRVYPDYISRVIECLHEDLHKVKDYYNLKVDLACEVGVGQSWKDTH